MMLDELVKKWRELTVKQSKRAEKHRANDKELNAIALDTAALTHRKCADELEAALAKAWPWRKASKELPKPGRFLLLYRGGEVGTGRFSGGKWCVDDIGDFAQGSHSAPTHWMYADEIPRPGGEDVQG